jgi:hypothetical protein
VIPANKQVAQITEKYFSVACKHTIALHIFIKILRYAARLDELAGLIVVALRFTIGLPVNYGSSLFLVELD